jgi:hypothetical protein
VVADRQLAPVRQQRVGVGPEHPAEVRRVLERRVEVHVVADRDRQPRLDVGQRDALRVLGSLPQRGPQRRPGVAPEREQRVQDRAGERALRQPGGALERGERDRVVAEPGDEPRRAPGT